MSATNVLVTGANAGIGRASAETLAARGMHVIVACRSREKAGTVLAAIAAKGGSAEFVPLDLADLDSVRACAKELLQRDLALHVLLNNAGVAGVKGATTQGFEMTFGTNHLGHFLLTTMLLPLLRRAAPSRIVNVSSRVHRSAKGIDWDALRKPTATVAGVTEYNVSKLCNVLFTKELARGRAGDGVHSYALHPGVIASDLWRQVPWPIRPLMTAFMKTTQQGAQTSIYCATSAEVADHDGRYYDDCKETRPSAVAEDVELARQLWEKSEEWVS